MRNQAFYLKTNLDEKGMIKDYEWTPGKLDPAYLSFQEGTKEVYE